LKEEAQKQLEEACRKEVQAQKELAQKEALRQEKLQTLAEVRTSDLFKTVLAEQEKDIKTNLAEVQTKLGLHGTINTFEEAGEALRKAQDVGGDVAKFVRIFVSAPGRKKRLSFLLASLGVIIVIPAIFTVAAGLYDWKPWTGALKWLVTAAAFVGTLINPIQETIRSFISVLEKFRAADTRFDTLVKERCNPRRK